MTKIDPKTVEAITKMDGSPIDKEEAAKMHALLVSEELKIKLDPGVAEVMAAAGLSIDDVRELFTIATRKTMS